MDAFYQAGLAAGGQDNGAPGIRPNITSLTMQPLSWIRMVIMSRQSATKNKNRKEKNVSKKIVTIIDVKIMLVKK